MSVFDWQAKPSTVGKALRSSQVAKANTKAQRVFVEGVVNPRCKPVESITETGITRRYPSAQSAAMDLGMNADSIKKAARTNGRCGGLKWKFVASVIPESRS